MKTALITGMAGSAIHRNLELKGYTNIITRTHSELDLSNQQAVNDFFETERPMRSHDSWTYFTMDIK